MQLGRITNTTTLSYLCNAKFFHYFCIRTIYWPYIRQAITNDCGFYDTVPSFTRIMADRGFNIQNECDARLIYFTVPPGRKGTAEMAVEVRETSKVAKLRILVEQVIRRVKTFKFLSQEVPISMLSHVKDILVVCCGLSNLKVPILK